MSRFARNAPVVPLPSTVAGPVRAHPTAAPTVTGNGGRGYLRDERSDLYLLAVTNMVGADTAYETAGARDDRYVALIHAVTKTDPAWVAAFLPWLRTAGLMRTASVIGAMEYARAGGPDARRVIANTLARGDEPAEAMAYWLSRYGRRMPMQVKKGLADACTRLYREDTPLRYDSAGHAVRPGDVIEYVHPRPATEAQAILFRHLIDRRHNRPLGQEDIGRLAAAGLDDLAHVYDAETVPAAERRAYLANHGLPRLMGWERVGGWLPGGLDANAWKAMAPTMGYMALVRNLRNIEKALDPARDAATIDLIRQRLVDPTAVARSRMFPYRFWQAYKATDGSLMWGRELEQALNLACANIPAFTGHTLVMVDASGSMTNPVAQRPDQSGRPAKDPMRRYQAAGLFAAAIALRNPGRVDVHQYGSRLLPTKTPRSVVQFIDSLTPQGGTNTWACTAEAYRLGGPYDRIVILTDEQANDGDPGSRGFGRTPIYVWNLAGYQVSSVQPGTGRTVLGGLSDASFGVVQLLERGVDAGWPWEDVTGLPTADGDGSDAD